MTAAVGQTHRRRSTHTAGVQILISLCLGGDRTPSGNREFVFRDPDGYPLVFFHKK
jgi:hypothetical protein